MRHIYKQIFLSISLMIIAIVAVMILVVLSDRVISHKNGFKRNFFKNKPLLTNELEMGETPSAVCGYSDVNLYFETNIPGKILVTDSNLNDRRFIYLAVPVNDIVNSLFSTFIDSPAVYIMAGNVPDIFIFNLYTDEKNVFHLPTNNFTRSAVIGNNSFVLRSYIKIAGKWEQEFIKWNAFENVIAEEKNISIRRGDAGFSTDGLLHYDKEFHRLLYVNYYINNFICFDTNLNLIYKSHTIDTTGTYQTVANILDGPKHTSATNISPIRDVNLQSCVSEGKLYINSALIADNETRERFISNSVIDIYNIGDGFYKGSFYIPSYKGERLKTFAIYNSRIVVLYPKYITIYSMNHDF